MILYLYYILETSQLEEVRAEPTGLQQELLAGPPSPASKDESTTPQGCHSLHSTVNGHKDQPAKDDTSNTSTAGAAVAEPVDLDQTDGPVPGGFVLPTTAADNHASPRHVGDTWTVVIIMIAIIHGASNPAHRVNRLRVNFRCFEGSNWPEGWHAFLRTLLLGTRARRRG